jgi:hypothetical protein
MTAEMPKWGILMSLRTFCTQSDACSTIFRPKVGSKRADFDFSHRLLALSIAGVALAVMLIRCRAGDCLMHQSAFTTTICFGSIRRPPYGPESFRPMVPGR